MLAIPEARDEALTLLADRNAFETVEAESDAGRFEDWAPELRAVFGRYQMIHSAIGGGRLSWSEIHPSDAKTGFTAIGSNETATVAARPSEDRIYEFDAEGNPPPWLEHRFQVYGIGSSGQIMSTGLTRLALLPSSESPSEQRRVARWLRALPGDHSANWTPNVIDESETDTAATMRIRSRSSQGRTDDMSQCVHRVHALLRRACATP